MAVSKKYNKETQTWEEVDFGGSTGASAYEVAVKNGFVGTEKEWLESLKGNVDLAEYEKTVDVDKKLADKLNKNLGSENKGKYLSVGADGNITLADAPSGGGETPEPPKPAPGERVDTTVVIEFPDQLTLNDGNLQSASGRSVSKKYSLGKTMQQGEKDVFVAKIAGSNIGMRNILQLFYDDSFVTYGYADYNENQTEEYNDVSVNKGKINSFRLTVNDDSVDDSYAYLKSTGQVFFAGKNTPYYGMSNIDGTLVGEEKKGSSVDETYLMTRLSKGVPVNSSIDANKYGLTQQYVDAIQQSYNDCMKEAKGDYNRIPVIIHTDEHGRVTGSSNPVMTLLGDMVDWYEMGKCIQLGDVCIDTYSEDAIKGYYEAMKFIPLSKRIEVYGNHDVFIRENGKAVFIDQKLMTPYFKNIYGRRHSNNGYFTVIDDEYNVKYLVSSDFERTPEKTNFRISTEQAQFLVDELSKDDGYDIIWCSHVPLLMDSTVTGASYNEKYCQGNEIANDSLIEMLGKRVTKGKGTFVDCDGVSHPYDFTLLKSDYLMSLHGHAHEQAYKTWESGLTEFVCDWFANGFYIGYIDRKARKFKTWKIENESTVVVPLEINI